MASALIYVTAILSVPLVIATCTLIVEILAATLSPGSTPSRSRGLRPCCAVLIPAHNEENGIARFLRCEQV
jgi:hypothetical protein